MQRLITRAMLAASTQHLPSSSCCMRSSSSSSSGRSMHSCLRRGGAAAASARLVAARAASSSTAAADTVRATARAASSSSSSTAAAAPAALQPQSDDDDAEWATVAAWRRSLLAHAPDHVGLVRGVSFEGRQGPMSLLCTGRAVLVLAEPWNAYDEHARAVYTAGGTQLGYLPAYVARHFPTPVAFGTVVSVGRTPDSRLFGARVAVKSSVHALHLDLLPGAWPSAEAALRDAWGSERYAASTQAVLAAYGQRCGISSAPAAALAQPLEVASQWLFNPQALTAQLAAQLPVCQPIQQLRQQLDAAGQQLLASPGVQEALAVMHAEEEQLGRDWQAQQLYLQHQQKQQQKQQDEEASEDAEPGPQRVGIELCIANAQTAHGLAELELLRAAEALPPELQRALRRLGLVHAWPELIDAVLYVLHAQQRRQELREEYANPEEGWRLTPRRSR